jgi:hypothetical protein
VPTQFVSSSCFLIIFTTQPGDVHSTLSN